MSLFEGMLDVGVLIPMPGDDIGVVLGLFDESIPKGLEVDGVSFSGGVI